MKQAGQVDMHPSCEAAGQAVAGSVGPRPTLIKSETGWAGRRSVPGDTDRVRGSYSTELAALEQTYAQALLTDVASLRAAVRRTGQGPAVFIGSGGSTVLAVLASYLHEEVFRQPARACTTLEAMHLPPIQGRGAMMFSSSAKHPDATAVLASYRRKRFDPAVLVTHRLADDVSDVAGADTDVVTLPLPARKDGFLATGSVLQIATLLLRSYLPEPTLPPVIKCAAEEPVRQELIVLTPPSLTCVAADIETRFAEAGLASVQTADFRAFAHGRHTGFARRSPNTTILVLSEQSSIDLATATADKLPPDADVRLWNSDCAWPEAVINLLVRSMHLAGASGESQSVEVSRPAVPDFGRKLYHLALNKFDPAQVDDGISRKVAAANAVADPEIRARLERSALSWTEAIQGQQFTGIVMDYDGTVCWTGKRWDLPDQQIQGAVTAILDAGITIGFASGRGGSMIDDLRRWIPTKRADQVIAGVHNGARCILLSDELEQTGPTEWVRTVATKLSRVAEIHGVGIKTSAHQVSIHGDTVGITSAARQAIQFELNQHEIDAQVVTSGHSIDIFEAGTTKARVTHLVEDLSGGQVLSIGDQGQPGGNDYALLSLNRWSLTVNKCSADDDRCWFAGNGTYVGPDLLLRYLKGVRLNRHGSFKLPRVTVK